MSKLLPLWALALLIATSSCRYYRQDLIFRTDTDADKAYIRAAVKQTEASYRIRTGDLIEFQVFTNGGELLIDPNSELAGQLSSGGATRAGSSSQTVPTLGNVASGRPRYLVRNDGYAKLPMVGNQKLLGFTLQSTDSLLSRIYAEFYKDAYVISRVANRRAFLFSAGGTGGNVAAGGSSGVSGRVILLENENMSIFEVLATSGGIAAYSRMGSVHIIRGDLTNPDVYVVNLKYVHTIAAQDLTVKPGDIIYIEPGRRPFIDIIRDVGTVGGLITGSAALLLLLLTR